MDLKDSLADMHKRISLFAIVAFTNALVAFGNLKYPSIWLHLLLVAVTLLTLVIAVLIGAAAKSMTRLFGTRDKQLISVRALIILSGMTVIVLSACLIVLSVGQVNSLGLRVMLFLLISMAGIGSSLMMMPNVIDLDKFENRMHRQFQAA